MISGVKHPLTEQSNELPASDHAIRQRASHIRTTRMPLDRHIEPEWLDELPADDPGALGSRQDLQRLNSLMGHVRSMARLLRRSGAVGAMSTLVELGAGDGTFLLRVARRIASSGKA